MKQILIIFSILLFSCDNRQEGREDEINSLKSSLRIIIKENQRIINLLELKLNGNPAAEPYLNLESRLNNLVLANLDTTFTNLTTDSNMIKSVLKDLNSKYLAVIDSTIKTSKYKLFLHEDDSLLRLPISKFLMPTKDLYINHFILTQSILYKHMTNLILLSNCVGSSGIRYFQMEKAGYQVNSIQNNLVTKIKLHYNFPKWWADYRLIELVSISDNSEKPVKTSDVIKTENDTIKLTLIGTTQKSFTANIKYSVLTPTGDKTEKIIEFPFDLW
jgi:hypothetical protein